MRFQIFTRSTINTNERYIDIDRKTLCCVSGDLLPFIRLENSHQVGKRLIYIVMYYCSIIMVVHFVGIEKLKDSLQTCKIISLPKDMLWQTFFVKVFHGIIGISFSPWRPIHRKEDLPLFLWSLWRFRSLLLQETHIAIIEIRLCAHLIPLVAILEMHIELFVFRAII